MSSGTLFVVVFLVCLVEAVEAWTIILAAGINLVVGLVTG